MLGDLVQGYAILRLDSELTIKTEQKVLVTSPFELKLVIGVNVSVRASIDVTMAALRVKKLM